MPGGGFIRDTAVCPTGKVVLAGGAQVVGEGTADFKTRIYESAPGTINGGAQSLWLVAMKNNSLNARTVGIFAVCGSKPAGYQVVRKDTTSRRRLPAQHGVLPRRQGHPRRRRERHRRRDGQLQHPPAGARARHRRRLDERPARLAAQLLHGRPHGRHPRRVRQPVSGYQVIRKDVLGG